jgi:glycosyltransferase involved in cell wall biosynthesis
MEGNAKELVIICPKQFGYLSDYYYYCKYLKGYNINFICKDQGLKKVETPDGTNVYYLSGRYFFVNASRRVLNLKLINAIYFIYYHKLCSLYAFVLPGKKKVLDIRTGEISENRIKKSVLNWLLKTESLFFDHTFIISESLRDYLNISLKNSKIVPLGAIEIGYSKRHFNELNLLYVGTFFNRDIHKTISGLGLFCAENPEIPVKYTIIGFGSEKDTKMLFDEIEKNEIIKNKIQIIGRLHHSELKEYFLESNIGVSFVPIVDYFKNQPPTKTFEYICSGLVCLATDTFENRKIINDKNGVLVNDNDFDFSKGLKQIWRNRNAFNSERIMNDAHKYHWDNIVTKQLQPALNKISDD